MRTPDFDAPAHDAKRAAVRDRAPSRPAEVLLDYQRTAGNAAVGEMIRRGGALQRTPEVPGMSAVAESAAKPLLAGSAADKQKAIDQVFAELLKNRRVPVHAHKLDGGKVHYDASVSGEGLTTTDYDANDRPRKCRVAMGDDAFSSLPWLYSSIIHELQHAQQRLAVNLANLASSPMRETESYCVEILRSGETGVQSDAAKMEDLWTRLHDTYWINITDAKEKKRMEAQVKRAHAVAEKATGKKLTFTP